MTENITSLQSKVIDWLRFPMAAAVVLLHAGEISQGTYGPDFYSTLRIILSHGICRVAVPCFFFISGFLFFSKLDKWDWGIWYKKIGKRARTLLLPYILWNLIALFVGCGYGWIRSRFNASVEPMSLINLLRNNGWLNIFWASTMNCPIDYPLWFIRDLIVIVAISPLIYLLIRYCKVWGLATVFIICILTGSRDIEGFLFFAFGAYLRLFNKDFIEVFAKLKWPAYALCIIGLVAIALIYRRDLSLYNHIKTPFMVVGVISVFNISSFLISNDFTKNNDFLSSASFFIFASHGILILHDIAHYFTLHFLPFKSVAGQCAVLFIKSAIAVCICLAMYALLKRIMPKTLALLTGNRS